MRSTFVRLEISLAHTMFDIFCNPYPYLDSGNHGSIQINYNEITK